MVTIHKPICFIAMAFGYDDTDKYYEKLVLPVLKRNNITPIIINRYDSNDDLNFQIIEQLGKADFCIVDLTYARQSVYFEAGFAEHKKIPVIYTVRKDHLGRNQPDEMRVHFDLQMKPLIDWKTQNDLFFPARLERRIKKTFLANWLRTQKLKQKNEEAEAHFNSLSSSDRLKNLRQQCILELYKKGYEKNSWNKNRVWGDENYSYTRIEDGHQNYVHGYKVIDKKFYATSVQSFVSPTKNELTEIDRIYESDGFLSKDAKKIISGKKIMDLHFNVLVLSLNMLSSARIENTLPYILPIENSKRYYYISTHQRYNPEGETTIRTEYYFLSGIKSESQFMEELNNNVLIYLV